MFAGSCTVRRFSCDYRAASTVRTRCPKGKQAPVIRNLLFSCALVFSATACGGGSDEAFMEKSVVMMEGLAKAIGDAGEDCGKMATNVGDFIKKNEGAMKEIKAKAESMKNDKAAAEKMAKAAEKYSARLEKAMPAMMGMMKCADDPKMKELQDKLKDFM